MTHFNLRIVGIMAAIGILAGVTADRVQASIVALYGLDEPASSAVTDPVVDSVGNHDAILITDGNNQGPTRGVAGVFGTAYEVTANSQGINLGSSSTVLPTGDFTVTLWINPSAFGDYNRILDATNGAEALRDASGYRIIFNNAHSNPSTATVLAQANGSAGGTMAITSSQVLDTGTWYFVALRYDVNGQGELTVLPAGNGNTGLTTGDVSNATVGKPSNGKLAYDAGTDTRLAVQNGSVSRTFHGSLDDVAFFNSVLTNQQLAAIYHDGAASQVPEPGTLALAGLGGLTLLTRKRREVV